MMSLKKNDKDEIMWSFGNIFSYLVYKRKVSLTENIKVNIEGVFIYGDRNEITNDIDLKFCFHFGYQHIDKINHISG